MALRKILRESDPSLFKSSRPVTDFNERLWVLLDDMLETMQNDNGVGLAAPQVGVLRRAVIVDTGDGVVELINPEIIESSEEEAEDYEGCLSCPGEYGYVTRPVHVKVKAFDRNGNPFEIEGDGLTARAFCHEIDHLNGIIFKVRARRMLTPKEVEELFADDKDEDEEDILSKAVGVEDD